MNVLHINAINFGGAWIAAQRISAALEQVGMSSEVVSLGDTRDSFAAKAGKKIDFELGKYSKHEMTVSLAKGTFAGKKTFQILELNKHKNVINFHWMPGLPMMKLKSLGTSPKFVWTLHDMNPFTGYCHHSFSCTQFLSECGACPQAPQILHRAISKRQKLKQLSIESLSNLSVIAPSEWLAEKAKASSVFKNVDISVINNTVPVELFRPRKKDAGANSRFLRIGILGHNYGTTKGSQKAISLLSKIAPFIDQEIKLIVFGDKFPNGNFLQEQIPHGSKQKAIIEGYQMCDFLIYLSTADNYPSVLLEAQACGIPVITNSVGGSKEIVVNEVTGLVTTNDNQTVQAVQLLARDVTLRVAMGLKAREVIIDRNAADVIAAKYEKAYLDE